jgi:hypothetical protein
MYMPRVNVQYLYVDIMGVEQGICLVYDEPQETERCLRILEENHRRLVGVLAESSVPIINFGDNVQARTLSADLFARYLLPVYQDRCEQLHAVEKSLHGHLHGDTGPLLRFARKTGLDGMEAITTKPQGDVEAEEVRHGISDEISSTGEIEWIREVGKPVDTYNASVERGGLI